MSQLLEGGKGFLPCSDGLGVPADGVRRVGDAVERGALEVSQFELAEEVECVAEAGQGPVVMTEMVQGEAHGV